MSEPAHLAVLAPNWLGDAVMTLPTIAVLRDRYPSARLTVVARRGVVELFEMVPRVDGVLGLEWDGRWWCAVSLAADVRRLRALQVDLAVLLPNSFGSAALTWMAGVRQRVGYGRDGRSWLLTRPVVPPRAPLHQTDYYLHLVDGSEADVSQERLRVPDDAVAAGRRLVTDAGWDGRSDIVVLAPGAAYGTAKQWTLDHAAALATRLVRERDATCVLVGSRGDAAATAAIVSAAGVSCGRIIDLAGGTMLAELAGICVLARACVSNDSGVMHVAAAVGTPVVALFGPTNEHATAPLVAAGGHVKLLSEPVDCRPCMLRTCPIDHRCMTRLRPERVLTAVDAAMGRRGGR